MTTPFHPPQRRVASNEPVYVISVAAELVGAHPQTLRSYERAGLVVPARTQGGTRRYSEDDITRLRRIQTLTDEGLTLLGVARVLELERRLAEVARPSTALVRRSPSRRPTRSRASHNHTTAQTQDRRELQEN